MTMKWNNAGIPPEHTVTVIVWIEEPEEEGSWDMAYYSRTYKKWIKTPEDVFCEPTHWMEILSPHEEEAAE